MQGSVSFQPAGEDDWIQADPNRPLTTGDNIWADQNSRGELHIGATSIRLSSETGISFLNLDDRTVQLQLAQGTIEVHLRAISNRATPLKLTLRISPSLSYLPANIASKPTPTAIPPSSSFAKAKAKSPEAAKPTIFPRDSNTSSMAPISSPTTRNPRPDSTISKTGPNRATNSKIILNPRSYVSRDIDGYYDLDQYGRGRTILITARCGFPTASPSVGRLITTATGSGSVPGVGRGSKTNRGASRHFTTDAGPTSAANWGWVPGPVVVRPVYAPAVVGFVGGGGGLSVGVGFGGGFAGVAWFPLGPRDVYVPAYHCSPRYVQYVNVTNYARRQRHASHQRLQHGHRHSQRHRQPRRSRQSHQLHLRE